MATLWNDIRYAARVLRKSPGFTAVVVVSLALGIGANTAIFSLVNAFLLRPMRVDHPERLVALYLTSPRWGTEISGISYPDLLDFRKQDTGLEEIMGSNGIALSMSTGTEPELVWGEIVTGNYFSGLGVHMLAGRGFLADEDRTPGHNPVCVLNYHFWQRRFHGDANIAGKSIKINDHAFTIVGVAPHGFIGTTLANFVPDIWVPAMMQQTLAPENGNYLEGRSFRWINARARLKPGVSRKQAEAALNVIAAQLARQYPKDDKDLSVHLIPGGTRTQPWLVANGVISVTTGVMVAVVLLVLLVACANVTNLMLARGASRAREMAIRVAVGAGRVRLVRQLLTESFLLSLAAGVIGLLFALWFSEQSTRFYPTLDFQTADIDYESRFDFRLLPFTFLISLATVVLFGLFPAVRASKVDQVSALKGEPAAVRLGRFRIGRGNLLVMLQVALSCLLLICGGLFLRSMQFANSADPGFYRTGITLFSVNPGLKHYDESHGLAFQRNLMDRVRAIPGVEDASLAFPLPLDAYDYNTAVVPEGYVPRSDQESNLARLSVVAPGYFQTMGTRIVAGRAIDDRDTASSRPVAVINETMAIRYWQTPERAVGRKFAPGRDQPPLEVAGVARNGVYVTFGESATSYYFVPMTQNYQGRFTVIVHSNQRLEALMPALRSAVSGLDPTLPVFGVRTMPQFLNRITSIYDMGASLVGTFAVMALLLAAVGIYGVLHFTVARRTREIGIRMALGAPRDNVLRLVLQRSLSWVMAGLCAGVGVALAASGITGRLLAGVTGSDPVTFGAVVLLFGLIALLASLVPARRATRVDPIQALRYE
jgi:predicted permease